MVTVPTVTTMEFLPIAYIAKEEHSITAWHETVRIGQLNGKRNRTFGRISGAQWPHFCNPVELPETFWNMREPTARIRISTETGARVGASCTPGPFGAGP